MKPEPKKLVTRGVEEEPGVGSGEFPVILFAILGGLLFLGLLYLDRFGGGYNNLVYRPYASYDQVEGLQPKDPAAAARARGKANYELACQICHQPSGLGVANQFPPLDGSEWVNGPINRLIRIPMHGLQGPIQIKDQAWEAAMPNAGAVFNDEQLADLLTYVRGSWSNKSEPITVDQVKKVRDEVKDRATPWTSKELLDLK